ncbi:MAG: ABC transporter ATP-binding protein [Chloroflexi bacterium RBG_16_56_11]|nr:MAG: ABC transporter ATP-binding protein [Chloroflexi bacterium RBG_16_56_11]
MLETEKLTASYGASQILFGINLQLADAETVCILGRNGVGKTTTLKTIMGMVRPHSGSIKFNGSEIGGLASYRISRLGVAYIPQGRHIFPNLTARENLLIAARRGNSPAAAWTIPRVYGLFPVLKARESFRGKSLSGGEQQMLCIARGLMQNPRLLLMDEIFEGLAPIVIDGLLEVVQQLKKSGVAILLAEQNVKLAMQVSSRCYILEKGQVVHSGNTSDVSQETIRKYLGT